MRRAFFFDRAFLPGGWRRRVRLESQDGIIASVETDAEPAPDDVRETVAIPGLPDLHSHAFQRAMAGMTERQGTGQDNFWSWRDIMYRFVSRMDPDAVEAIAAYAYADMLEAGFTTVGEFHYVHRDVDGASTAIRPSSAYAALAAAGATGLDITLLPVFYAASNFGGAAPTPGQKRFITDVGRLRRHRRRLRRRRPRGPASGWGSRPLPARRPGRHAARHPAAEAGRAGAHPRRRTDARGRGLPRLVGQAAGGMAAGRDRPGPALVPGARHPPDGAGDGGPGRQRRGSPACARSPRPTWAMGSFLRAISSRPAGASASARIPTSRSTPRASCACSNTGRGWSTAPATSLTAPSESSTGTRLFEAALAGGAQALGLGPSGLVAGARTNFVVLDAAHPDLAQADDARLLDTWIFSTGRRAILKVVAGGRTVVENGRHLDRDRIDARYGAALAKLM